jgi:hypothetical protein
MRHLVRPEGMSVYAGLFGDDLDAVANGWTRRSRRGMRTICGPAPQTVA